MIPISFTNSVIKIIFSISFPLGKMVCDVSVGIPQCSITPKPFTVTMISQDFIRYSHFGYHNWCLGGSLLFKKFDCYWLFFQFEITTHPLKCTRDGGFIWLVLTGTATLESILFSPLQFHFCPDQIYDIFKFPHSWQMNWYYHIAQGLDTSTWYSWT